MRKLVAFLLVFGLCFFVFGVEAKQKPKSTLSPKKVNVDTNYDGKIDRTEVYNEVGEIISVESDTNGDTIIDEWIIYEKGKPIKSEKDINDDGKPDVWVDY